MKILRKIQKKASGNEAANKNKAKTAIAGLLIALLLTGGMATMAYLTDTTEVLTNIFSISRKYVLTYHANTGDTAEDAKVKVPGKQESYGEGKFTISSEIPVRENFVFTGWYLNEEGSGDKINTGRSYTTTEYRTDLYAQWEIGYTVEYNANGGTGAPAADTKTSEETSETFNIKGPGSMVYKTTVGGTETTEAKVFLGWSTNPEAEEPEYTSDGKYAYTGADLDGDKDRNDFDKTITLQSTKRKVTLYAVWATRYKLIFDANAKYNGTGNVPPTQTKVSTKDSWAFDIIKNNDDNDDPAITPKRTDESKGYRFGWWCDNPDSRTDGPGTYQYGDKGVVVYNETTERFRQDPWRVLYAVYKPPKTLGLFFDANGGNKVRDTFGVYWGSVLTEKQLVDIPNDPDPIRNNYVFMGWSKNKDRKTDLIISDNPQEAQKNGDFHSGDRILIDIWEDSAPTLYAVWRAKHNFRIQFHLNDGSVGYYKDGTWKTNNSSTGMYYETGYVNSKEEIVNENTWPESHFATHGVYATRNPDATNSYKFLGWHSSDKSLSDAERRALTKDDVDYPVELPPNPLDPNGSQEGSTPATGTEGCITKEVTVKHTAADPCTSPTTHYKYMYAVWEKTPLHSYKIIFTNKDIPNNRNMDGISIVNKAKNNAAYSESESASLSNPIKSTKGNVVSNYTIYGKKLEKNSLPISDNPYATWTVDELSTSDMIPYAVKTATATERYEFAGWSYTPNGQVDIEVDSSTGKITSPITIDDPDPDNCKGEIHYLLLFPVFKTVPQHTYNIYLMPNYSAITSSNYDRNMQFKWVNNNNWYTISNSYRGITIKDINDKEFKNFYAGWLTSKNQEVSVDTWGSSTAERNWWHNNGNDKVAGDGIKAYCTKRSTAPASAPDFKFLGWSYNRNGKDPAELGQSDVDIPADANGCISGDIILKEADVPVSGDHCSDSKGYVHNVVLYGVWQSDKAHQYTVIFSGSLDGSTIMAKESATADFKEQTTKIMTNVKDYNDKEFAEIKYAWECDGPAEKLEDDADAKYDFTSAVWADKGVYATKEKDAKYEYKFLGWSTNPNDKEDPAELVASDVDVKVDEETGHFITTTVTIKDNDKDNCPGNVKHYAVLYAVWEKTPIPATHTFTVKFDRNSQMIYNTSTSYKYYDSASSSWKTSTDAKYGTYTTEELKVSEYNKFDFDNNYWKNTGKGLSATKSNSYVNSFDFVGWSYGREGVQPRNLTKDDVDITLDEDGFIKDTITVKCDDPSCEGGKHEMTLYAIWEAKPLTKNYILSFDLNTKAGEQGSNCPDPLTGSEVYGATTPGAWVNSYEFTLPDNSDAANLPKYKSMTFVGWSTDRYAMPGEYGFSYGNPELRDTTKNLKNKIKLSTTSGGSGDVKQTLYAIWAYEYQMTYDPNDGQSGPSMEHEYTNQAKHNYTMSESYPSRAGYKFLGWADREDATEPDYYPNNTAFENDKPKVKVVNADPSGSTKLKVYAVWQKD